MASVILVPLLYKLLPYSFGVVLPLVHLSGQLRYLVCLLLDT